MQGNELWSFLKRLKNSGLTKQQFKTIRGQALAGDLQGAQKGLDRLMREKEKRKKGAVV